MSIDILTPTQALGVLRHVAAAPSIPQDLGKTITAAAAILADDRAVLQTNLAAPEEYSGRVARAAVPTEGKLRILKRIYKETERYLLVTNTEKGRSFSYEDGSVPRTGGYGSGALSETTFRKFRRNGWIIPVEDETLIAGTPARVG